MGLWIVLYRGINVVGKNRVKMESLRALHERLGHRQVNSYIQSGNIILSADEPAQAIVGRVSAGFEEEFGFAARVLVVPMKRWGTLIKANPFRGFAAENPTSVHVGICDGVPSEEGLNVLKIKTAGTESFAVRDGVVYLHAPDGYGKSKFAARMERACGTPMTVRNWRTVEALWGLANLPAG
jgi:uncharacterized protein (DUF1697 family)